MTVMRMVKLLVLAAVLTSPSSSTTTTTAVVQRFMREPPDQTAAEGEHVTLPCRVDNKVGNLQWTRDDFGLGLNRNLKGFERYRMSGSDEEGDYTLDIDQVTLEDDARFQCQVGAAPGVAPVRSRYAVLTVTVRPEAPVILAEEAEVRTQEDRVLSLECVSRGGKPAAEITWLDNWNTPILHHIETITETLPDGKRENTRSLLRLVMTAAHHNTSLTCEAQNSAESVPQSASIRVFVEFAPSVSLSREPAVLREGDTAVFSCSAAANPALVTYKWFLGGREVAGGGDSGARLVVADLSRSQAGQIVKCQVTNSIGKSEETYSLDIFYSPELEVRPASVSGDLGEEVVLQCLASSNPPPAYKWFRNDDLDTVIGYSSNLTIFVSGATTGRYTCTVTVAGYEPVQAAARVYARGPPAILNTPENSVQYGTLGETVQVGCEAVSVPPAENVVWKYKDYPVNTRTQHYQVLTKRGDDRAVSTLVIKNSVLADFGVYNCTARNSYGEHFQLIEVVRKEDTRLLLSLVAVVSGGVVVMALLLILLHCRRRSQAKERTGAEETGKEDRSRAQEHEQEVWPGMEDAELSPEAKAGNGLSVVAANMYGNNGAATLGNNGTTFGNNGVGPFGSNGAATLGPGPPQLNISNPRYSAMYRNTLLQEPLPPPTPVYPGHGPPVPGSPMSVRSGLVPSSPYLTMRPHPHHLHHQQYIQAQEGLTNGRLATHV